MGGKVEHFCKQIANTHVGEQAHLFHVFDGIQVIALEKAYPNVANQLLLGLTSFLLSALLAKIICLVFLLFRDSLELHHVAI